MKTSSLLLAILCYEACLAQFKVAVVEKNSIPKTIQYKGEIANAVRWRDSSGTHIFIATIDKTQGKGADEGLLFAALHAYHYSLNDNSWVQTWKVYDFIEGGCALDLDFYFIDKAFAITDLNKNGKAETWLMYKISCHGDVSPVPMKIIMYEDNKKFAARGTTRVEVGTNDFAGGELKFDDAFQNGPEVFRQYAEKLWNKNRIETWGGEGK